MNLSQNSKHKLILMLLELNWLFYILDKDNIISASVSEVVEKIPTDEKDYRKCPFMCFTMYSHNIQRATSATAYKEQTNM